MAGDPLACWFFHRWSKWKELSITMARFSKTSINGEPVQFVKRLQRRQCEDCGLIEERALGDDW